MPLDLTKQSEAIAHMKESKSPNDWNDRVKEVAEANNGKLPPWWKFAILDSGVGMETSKDWYIP